MTLFDVLALLGGLALFLYGMNVMGDGLERSAGSKLKHILEKLTSSTFRGVLLGAGVTAVIQSSSATTVMVVGFVNSGVMTLRQAIGVIMGANIGTTITAWILSLSGLQGDSLLIQMLKPSSFAPILALIGIVLVLFVKDGKKRDIGTVMLGFTVLMTGMDMMSGAVEPLKNVPEFANILMMFQNPILGVLAGAAVTGIIQSSSASVGILQALSATGSITFGAAIPIIMGQNIGTTVTAMLSSVGTNKNARRTALVHLYFNLVGTAVFCSLFYILNAVVGFTFTNNPIDGAGIALVHTAFNVANTLLLLPFARQLESLAYRTVRDEGVAGDATVLLDERLLSTPSIAIERCRTLACEMARISRDSLMYAMELTHKYNAETAQRIVEMEDKVDEYEDKLGTYLVQLSSRSLSESDSREVSKILHCIGDFERISDHSINILTTAREIHEKNAMFSDDAQQELRVIGGAVEEVLGMAVDAFATDDVETASQVEPLEQVVDKLKTDLKRRHIVRLQQGRCTIEQGFIFSDLLANFERVADHCSNIAVCVIEIDHGSFKAHEYLHEVKESANPLFAAAYQKYSEKYAVK